MKYLLAALLLVLGAIGSAQAQGCGPANPNCVVPTVTPASTSDNRAASTAFVHNVLTTGLAGIVVAVRNALATPDSITTTDYFICPFNGSGAAVENLPPSPATGLTFLIKDCNGHALANNITVTPASGNIDGNPTFVMNINFQSIAVTYNGTQWSIN